MGLLNQFKQIIGPNTFSCKSTSTHLKVQTDTPDNYRKIIYLLKEFNAQYHKYQLQSDKPLRVVIRNLHPSTPESDIKTAIEEIGYTVRNVTNIKHHQTKTSLPMFFIDIDPNGESDADIFSITSILHTKVKMEEPHKKRQIPQCLNCQNYGYTRSYCAYPSICVKCGQNYLSSGAQNHQIYQQNAASVKESIQPTTRDAQYIKQFTGSATTTTQAKMPSSHHPLISTPTLILNINNNNQAPKTYPGHVRMQM